MIKQEAQIPHYSARWQSLYAVQGLSRLTDFATNRSPYGTSYYRI